MRKMKLCLIMLGILIVTKTNAQHILSLGPIVGLGQTWQSGATGTGYERRFKQSLNIGGRLVYITTPHLGFGLDVTFRKEGMKFEPTIKDSVYPSLDKLTSRTNYIRIDPKVYYFFGKYDQAFRPKIGIGPSLGFLVGGETATDRTIYFNNVRESKRYYKSFDFGLSGSLGFNFQLKNNLWVNTDAVYSHGLTNISKNSANETLHNRSLFLNVGVTFDICHAGEKGLKEIKIKEIKM